MFWNKKIIEVFKTNTSQLEDIKAQMDEIDRVYKNPENAGESMTIERFSRDAESYRIIESYYVKAKQLARFTKDVRDLRAVVEGNGEYWASYQNRYKECQLRLEDAQLHLRLEKEMYQKLYERNRELETKLYMAEREIEILKGAVK
jgi:hypothetical protein